MTTAYLKNAIEGPTIEKNLIISEKERCLR